MLILSHTLFSLRTPDANPDARQLWTSYAIGLKGSALKGEYCHAPFRTPCPTPDSSPNSFPAPLHTPTLQLRTSILRTPSGLRVCLQNLLSPSPLSLLICYTFPYRFTAFSGLISTPYLTILFHISSYAPLLVHMLPLATRVLHMLHIATLRTSYTVSDYVYKTPHVPHTVVRISTRINPSNLDRSLSPTWLSFACPLAPTLLPCPRRLRPRPSDSRRLHISEV